MRRTSRATSLAILVFISVALPTATAGASTNVNDVTEAVRYNGASNFGQILPTLSGQDDEFTTVELNWPVNVFGSRFDALCVMTNGSAAPVASTSSVCSDEYNVDLAYQIYAAEAPVFSVLGVDLDLAVCDGRPADDGFGQPCEIYFDPNATVDGREAAVVTWYRVSAYDDGNNSNSLENTFQLVLIKRDTVDGDNVGYDFDIEFNYGTVRDDDQGYDVNDPSRSCDASAAIGDCRWAVGLGNYSLDALGDPVVTAYEFFESVPIADLVDGGSFALTEHSLNSSVSGRYTCALVAGLQDSCDGEPGVPLAEGPGAPESEGPELAATGLDTGAQGVMTGGLVAALVLASAGALLFLRRSEVDR